MKLNLPKSGSFKEIRENNLLYVDKTDKIIDLIDNKYTFLSRPRRFGKTLLVNTLYHLLNGDKELFKGLYIYDKWDWNKKYPIIRLALNKLDFEDLNIDENLLYLLEQEAIRLNVLNDITKTAKTNPDKMFGELINKIAMKYNQKVVILIDEYDKPILDNLENKQLEYVRKKIGNFYGIIKSIIENDDNVEFTFITGITNFSQINMFSGFNNLEDLSLNENFNSICGYTQKDIETTLKPYLNGVNLDMLKYYYNGYCFSSKLNEKLYNPYDVLLFIRDNYGKNPQDIRFKNYWINTGNSQLINKLLQKAITQEKIDDFNDLFKYVNGGFNITSEHLNEFQLDLKKLPVLLYQAGYLTIIKKETMEVFVDGNPSFVDNYKLAPSNLEVKNSLGRILFDVLMKKDIINFPNTNQKIQEALYYGDVDIFVESINHIYAYIKSGGDKGVLTKEFYYASLFFIYLHAIGYDYQNLIQEDQTNKGRIDLTIHTKNIIYLIEFKTNLNSDDAFKQIVEKKYYEKFLNSNKKVIMLGITFDVNDRNISDYKHQLLDEFLIELKEKQVGDEDDGENTDNSFGGIGD